MTRPIKKPYQTNAAHGFNKILTQSLSYHSRDRPFMVALAYPAGQI